jgi:hypothetical protein
VIVNVSVTTVGVRMKIKIGNDLVVEGNINIVDTVITINGNVEGDCTLPNPSSKTKIESDSINITNANVDSLKVEYKGNKILVSIVCSIVTYNFTTTYIPYKNPCVWPYKYDSGATWLSNSNGRLFLSNTHNNVC